MQLENGQIGSLIFKTEQDKAQITNIRSEKRDIISRSYGFKT